MARALKFRDHCADEEYIGANQKLETHDQPASALVQDMLEKRRKTRFKLEVDLKITSRTCGLLKGYSVDISESGISAMLRIEVPVGEIVELAFTLPLGAISIYAIVRQRNAFRYGFQFVESDCIQEIIRPTCRELAIEQSPLSGL